MATATEQKSPPEQRIILKNVSWQTYEALLADHIDSSVPHFIYDRGELEIVSPSTPHEETNRTLASLVEIIAEELSLNLRNVGSMTFKREDLQRGFEPDTSFYIQSVMRVMGKVQIDAAVDPPPDLVIEIDVSSTSLDKLAIYAHMGIPEVWRYLPERDQISIVRLDGDAYVDAQRSAALPPLTPEAVMRFVAESRFHDRLKWTRSVRNWARDHQQGHNQ